MAAGLTDHVWSIAELLEVTLAEGTPEKPSNPPPPPARRREPIPEDGPIPIGRPTKAAHLRIVKGGAS